jgi:hypothetical protein
MHLISCPLNNILLIITSLEHVYKIPLLIPSSVFSFCPNSNISLIMISMKVDQLSLSALHSSAALLVLNILLEAYVHSSYAPPKLRARFVRQFGDHPSFWYQITGA